MEKLIERIISGTDLNEVYDYVKGNILRKGPVDIGDMEILSYLCEYDYDRFIGNIDGILNCMALFYKGIQPYEPSTLQEMVMLDVKESIREVFAQSYTPVQADIRVGSDRHKCYSFAAPTSTGKSFVLMDLIKNNHNDVVVVVPSRALINEYYIRLNREIEDKTVNILTFIDRLNTAHSRKNIFIVTPERCRQLFLHKDDLDIGLILFDEAQLSEEGSIRGLLFDSIVRRCEKHFKKAKIVFAHPFIYNPEAQINKNHLEAAASAYSYQQRTVGQMYFYKDGQDNYYHIGIRRNVMGHQRVKCEFDPVRRILESEQGSVMIYVSKSSIMRGSCLEEFKQYVGLCKTVNNEDVDRIVEKLEAYTGANTKEKKDYYSSFIDLLRRGIVLHHGSLPMKSRILIEEYVRQGHCRLCFATSTLEQGINMPFEAVLIDKFGPMDSLAVKNLIGRAGRSTKERKFDYGYVILTRESQITMIRKALAKRELLKETSSLDERDKLDEDYRDFKDAVNNGTINDSYNLTPREIEKITTEEVYNEIDKIVENLFYGDTLVNQRILYTEGKSYRTIIQGFINIYRHYLGRDIEAAEGYVLEQAIIIMLYKIYGRTFKNICWHRYNYASRLMERKRNETIGKNERLAANFMVGYKNIPDRYIRNYPLFDQGTNAEDVSYDRIIYDTYDYLDKLVNFKLSDVFYASVEEYYQICRNEKVKKLALLVRYGTYEEKYIWMLRYGLAFEDIEILEGHIEHIDETGITFRESVKELGEEDKIMIERFIN